MNNQFYYVSLSMINNIENKAYGTTQIKLRTDLIFRVDNNGDYLTVYYSFPQSSGYQYVNVELPDPIIMNNIFGKN